MTIPVFLGITRNLAATILYLKVLCIIILCTTNNIMSILWQQIRQVKPEYLANCFTRKVTTLTRTFI